jgi:hypothetical protein
LLRVGREPLAGRRDAAAEGLTDELKRGEMVAIPIVDPVPSWTLAVVVSQRTMNARGSEAVARIMADLIAEMVEQGTWRAKLHGDKVTAER